VVRGIRQVTERAHALGKHVAVCGEAAGDPVAAGSLVGLGVDELSLSPAGIPAIKLMIRGETKLRFELLARQALKLSSTVEVRALMADSVPIPG
jgi:phosphoenolpyruvate-protein kinase (PTS system EI component)